MWANTVLASSGHVLGMIVYTGKETRAQMNSKPALTKVGKLELEINRLSKFLFVFDLLGIDFEAVELGTEVAALAEAQAAYARTTASE
jgi:magnesium-transporting ATPase (P-type)